MKTKVITISDRASRDVYPDLSGPAIEKTLREYFGDIEVLREIVADDSMQIWEALQNSLDADIIITSGGTGPGPRDITPEVTKSFCERMTPGIAEYIRARSIEQSLNAILSRGVAGIKGSTVIINLPGSPGAASFCTEIICPVLKHAVEMAKGGLH